MVKYLFSSKKLESLLVGIFCVLSYSLGLYVARQPPKTPPPIEALILKDGQSAQVLESGTLLVRIPYNGDELYVGPVLIQRGSMIVKPLVEE